MLHSWTTLVLYSHFLIFFQDACAQLIFTRPGISTVMQPPIQVIGKSTGHTLNNILLASFEQSPKAKEHFSSYRPPQQQYNSPPVVGNSFGVPYNPTAGYNKPGSAKVKVSSFKVTNITSSTLGMLNLPFGERSTFALTFPPSDENLFQTKYSNLHGDSNLHRDSNSQGDSNLQGDYAIYGEFIGQQSINEVKFAKEATINVGSIVSDAFVLKERMDIQPGSPSGSNPSDPSVINRIINNAFAQNTAKILNARNQPNIHSPGDLIAREIPLNGIIDYTGLNNLTEFLIRETSKPRSMQKLIAKQAGQTPMFVSLQFNTLGRQKIQSYNEGVEKKGRIHVVLGNKHFEMKNIEDLSQLNGQSQTTVELIKQFVNFSWKTHQDIFRNTEMRSKDISDRLAALIQEDPGNTMRFQPNRPLNQEQPLDFATWPYVVTLAFRTLLV